MKKVQLVLMLILWSSLLAGCSVHFGVDWQGKTEIDDRRTTQAVINKGGKY